MSEDIAGMATIPSSSTTAASGADGAASKEIRALFAKNRYEAVIQKADAFAKRYPTSAQLGNIENLRGLAFLLTQRAPQAIAPFKRAIDAGAGNPTFQQYVYYNLAKAQYESGQIADAQQTVSDVRPEVMDKANRLKVHVLRANIYLKTGIPFEAARESLIASRLLAPEMNPETRASLVGLLEKSMNDIRPAESIATLYTEFEDSPIGDTLLFRMGSNEPRWLETLTNKYPQSPYAARASELLQQQVADTGVVNPSTIGVLIPTQGKFAKLGERTLRGIELALGIFGRGKEASNITLVIEDSGDEPDQAVRALERLVSKHHVAAVIGPLTSKGIDKVTDRARYLGVPLVSLARYAGTQSEWIFQAGLGLRLQAEEIARQAIEQMGMKRFAILYPKDKVGEESAQYFWNAVESLGGEIRGFESYRSDETDFRQPIDKLSGLFYTGARDKEIIELAKQREAMNIKKRTRKTEQYFALKPIVDYDAVFIPDEPKISGQILPTFAYRDVDNVKFLGTSAWNTPELATRAQAASEKAFFVDAFFSGSSSPTVKRYISLYKETFDEEPSAIDAVAYDAAKLVEQALAHGASSRGSIRSYLSEIQSYSGVTGKITFKDGLFARNLEVLTFKDGQIVEARAN